MGFAQGRILNQVEWSSEEIAAVNDLIRAGKAEVIQDWATARYSNAATAR